MTNAGYFISYRSKFNLIKSDILLLGIYYYLEGTAQFRESEVLWCDKRLMLKPGQLIFSMHNLANIFGIHRKTIAKKIRQLESMGLIKMTTSKEGSLCEIMDLKNDILCSVESDESDGPRSGPGCGPDDGPDIEQLSIENNREILDENKSDGPGCGPDDGPRSGHIRIKKVRNKKNNIVLSEQDQREFDLIYQEYPKRQGGHNLAGARKSFFKNFGSAEKQARLLDAIKNYSDYCKREKKIGTSFVLMFATFINSRWEEWENIQPIKKPTYLRVCNSLDEI